jgi:translocation and assembly module TamB
VVIFQHSSAGGDPGGPKHRTRHRVAIIAKWVGGVIVFPILFGLIVAIFLIHTSSGKNKIIRIIQDQASKSLNTAVRLQNFNLHLSTLSADLYGLTIYGAGPHPYPPLLEVPHASAGVRIVSLFGGKWYFDHIRIDNPVARLYVDKNGVSNLPTLKSSGNSNTSIFDLGIRHAVLTNGTVSYNDRPQAIALDLHDVDLDSTFNSVLKKYSGTLTYSDGRFNYAGEQAPQHTLSVQFDATPNTFHLAPAKIQCGNSHLLLTATVNNYSAPAIEAQYEVIVDGGQVAGILHNSSIPAGLVAVSGKAHYQSSANRTLLESLAIDGDLTSRQLIAKTPSLQAQISNIAAHYSLANGDATLRDFRASALGGEITLQGTMKDLGGNNAHSRFDAALHNISLAEAKRTAGKAASTGAVEIGGTVNGTATATWGKTLQDLVAHTDLAIHGRLANAQHGQVVRASAPQPAAANPNTIPVEGALHAAYNASSQQVAVNHSYLRTPQTNLDLNGTVSKNSSLAIQLQANDLRELESVADLFRSPAPGQAVQPLGLAGTASFNGVVRGSTSAPHLSGQMIAHNLQLHGSSWKLVRTNLEADPSQVRLQNAELDPASKGRITLNAGAQLRNWTFSKSSPVQIQLNATQLDLSELARLADQQVPMTGTIAANISVHGSVLNPMGNGDVRLTNAAAYGETITSAKVTFNGSGNQAHANLSIAAPAGTIDAKATVNPKQKTYSAELTSSGIHLEKLETLHASSAAPTGVVAIHAKGQGTFDNPQLDATIQIPKLVAAEQTISDIRLQASLANHQANAQFTSSAVNSAIKGNAKIVLAGDYPADATLDTQAIPLGPLFAAYAPDQAGNVSGQTELHATLHGPLKNKQLLEAHATIPVLKLAYGSDVQLAATAPIHIDYKNGTMHVQRSAIKGTDTDLQFEGTVPTTGNAPMSLLLLGSVDLHLVQLFDPDLHTSGQVKFNVNSYGGANGRDVAGTINVVDASMTSADLPIGLQHGNGTLTLTRDRINISSFEGQVGGGNVTAQGGVALRPAIQFDMGLAARDVRMLYPQGMRESVNANIRFTGSTTASVLGGNVNLTDLSFTPGFDLNTFISQVSGGVEAPPSQGFTDNIALNLAVHSTNNVNLVSRTLSVNGSANLQIRGTADDPVILGRVNLAGGDIILNGNRYVLTGGTIQFVNPSVTQPDLNLTITTTIQQYNISLRFEGPVDQMRTQYTSDPALPQADIIHLLAFGKTTEAAAASATPANQAAEALVANQVSSQVTSRISKVAGISQLSINPVLAGGGQQGPAGANITIQQRVTSNLFITFSSNVTTTQGQTIQGQYQVSPRVAVSATRDPNGGFAVDTLIKKSW